MDSSTILDIASLLYSNYCERDDNYRAIQLAKDDGTKDWAKFNYAQLNSALEYKNRAWWLHQEFLAEYRNVITKGIFGNG